MLGQKLVCTWHVFDPLPPMCSMFLACDILFSAFVHKGDLGRHGKGEGYAEATKRYRALSVLPKQVKVMSLLLTTQ